MIQSTVPGRQRSHLLCQSMVSISFFVHLPPVFPLQLYLLVRVVVPCNQTHTRMVKLETVAGHGLLLGQIRIAQVNQAQGLSALGFIFVFDEQFWRGPVTSCLFVCGPRNGRTVPLILVEPGSARDKTSIVFRAEDL